MPLDSDDDSSSLGKNFDCNSKHFKLLCCFLDFDYSQDKSSSESLSMDNSSMSLDNVNMSHEASNTSSNALLLENAVEASNSDLSISSQLTEEYELPSTYQITGSPIDFSEGPADFAISEAEVIDDEDDDVILIPQVIETIDLCTQAQPLPTRSHHAAEDSEVIVIGDSPMVLNRRPRHHGPIHCSRRFQSQSTPYMATRSNSSNSMASTSSTAAKARSPDNLRDEVATQKISFDCPICLDSIVGKEPVSTICGHLFCKVSSFFMI